MEVNGTEPSPSVRIPWSSLLFVTEYPVVEMPKSLLKYQASFIIFLQCIIITFLLIQQVSILKKAFLFVTDGRAKLMGEFGLDNSFRLG
jgi:hypothetical protein